MPSELTDFLRGLKLQQYDVKLAALGYDDVDDFANFDEAARERLRAALEGDNIPGGRVDKSDDTLYSSVGGSCSDANGDPVPAATTVAACSAVTGTVICSISPSERPTSTMSWSWKSISWSEQKYRSARSSRPGASSTSLSTRSVNAGERGGTKRTRRPRMETLVTASVRTCRTPGSTARKMAVGGVTVTNCP